jgi:putative PIN family toxin of toxin-antitoxin system
MSRSNHRRGVGESPSGSRLFVIDTNVWISAALSRKGAPAQLVQHVLAACKPVFSQETFAELETRLWKPKFDPYLSVEMRHAILHDAAGAAVWVEVPPDVAAMTFSRDADDDKFVHAALASGAAYLVSGDSDLLDVPRLSRPAILSPGAALRQVFGVE